MEDIETVKTQLAQLNLPKLVRMSTSYKLIIPAEVEAKIRFTCNKVWDVEWSGTLFYTVEGNFEDGSLVITAKDIYVMDIGTSGYTEFDMSPDVISYMTEHPELLDYQMGLVHSHNTMATFFSGTDQNTLKEEGKDRNHFVSLIVNNAGTYTAAITRLVKGTKNVREVVSYKTFGGECKETTRTFTEEVEQLEWFNLAITKEDTTGFDELEAKLEEIKKSKTAKPSNTNLNINGYNVYGSPTPINIVKPETPKIKEPEFNFKDDETVMYGVNDIKFEEDTIKALALELITGSIVIPNNSSLDINKWVNSMPGVYAKRFGEGEQGFQVFQNWIDLLVEFILNNTIPDSVNENYLEEDYFWSYLAVELINYLSKYPSNKYLKAIIDELNLYVL